MKKTLEKILDILGEICAVLTVVLYAVLIINANWTFIPAGLFFDIFKTAKVRKTKRAIHRQTKYHSPQTHNPRRTAICVFPLTSYS